MPLLSVCIPVYNARRYLDACIRPLLAMGDQVQIILSDDGSTDDSPRMCRTYAENNANVVYLTGSNGGPSAARNRALEQVSGQYTTFVDADDILDTEAIDYLKKLTEKDTPDIIQFGVVSEFGTWSRKRDLLYDSITLLDAHQRHRLLAYTCGLRDKRDLGHAYFGLVSCRFYRTELLQGLTFDATIVGEDTLYAVQAMKRMKSAVFLPEYLYHYRVSGGTYSRKQFSSIVPMAAKMLELLKQEVKNCPDCDRLLQRAWACHGYDKLIWCLEAVRFTKMTREEQTKTLKRIFSYEVFAETVRKMPLNLLSERRILTVMLLRLKLYRAATQYFLL